jgi:hypothetical protein
VKEPQYQGYVWSFLFSSMVTLWAVAGELLTVFLLFREIRTAQSLSKLSVWVMLGVVVFAAVLLLLYAWTSIRAILKDQIDLPKHRRRTRNQLLLLHPAVTLRLPEVSSVEELRGASIKVANEGEAVPALTDIDPELPSWHVL